MNAPHGAAGAFDHGGSRASLAGWALGLIGLALSACVLLLAPAVASASGGPTSTVQAPTLSQSFPSTWVAHGGTIASNFTLSNPNQATDFAATSFSDTLPPGLVLANPVGASGTCLSLSEGIVSGSPGARQFQLSGASLPSSSSCTLTINVVGTVSGRQTNTTKAPTASYLDQASQVQTISGLPALASLIVLFGPKLHVAFAAPTIALHGVTTLRIKLRNPSLNPVALTGVTFTDQLPANLAVASPSSSQNTCGGTWQIAAGSSTVQLSGGTIARATECSLTVDVVANSEGLARDLAGAASSENGGAGNGAEASVVVVRPPTIAVQMQRWVYQGGTVRVRFTMTNLNSAANLNILVFYVRLSPKLTVAADPNVVSDCAGASVTAQPGQNTMRFLNGQLPAASTCQVTVTLRAGGLGVKRVETSRVAAIGTVPGNRAVGQLTVVTCHNH